MDKDRLYFISNKVENILVLVTPILLLIGFRWFPFFIRISAFLFIAIGVFYFIRFAYFRKTQVLFTDRGTGLSALIYVLLVGIVAIGVGVYILMRL